MARSEKLATETLPVGPGNHVSRRAFLFAAGALAMAGCANKNTPAPTSEATVTTPDWDATETGAPQTAGPSDVETTPVATSDPTEIKIKRPQFDVSGPDRVDHDQQKALAREGMEEVMATFWKIAERTEVWYDEAPVTVKLGGQMDIAPVVHDVQTKEVSGGVVSTEYIIYITVDNSYSEYVKVDFNKTVSFQANNGDPNATHPEYPNHSSLFEIEFYLGDGTFGIDTTVGEIFRVMKGSLEDDTYDYNEVKSAAHSITYWTEGTPGTYSLVTNNGLDLTAEQLVNGEVVPANKPRELVNKLLTKELPQMAA